MNRRFSARPLIAAALGSVLVIGLLPTVALGVPIPARASLLPVRQFVGDSTGRVLTFRVRNIGTVDGIGAVRISRPSAFWTVAACPSGPTGWTRTVSAASCDYTSNPGNSDDIPLNQGRPFNLRATTAPSAQNVWGTWLVQVSSDDDLTNVGNILNAAPMGMGLRTRAFSFEVTDLVVSSSTATVGDPCPAADKTADAGSTGNYVIACGRNHTNVAQTPLNQYAKLLGSMIASHGAFTGGSVPASDSIVVLGYWSNVTISPAAGTGKALRARVGSGFQANSPVRRFTGFEAATAPAPLNVAPSLDNSQSPALAGVNEDPGAPSGAVGTTVASLVDYTPPVGGVDNVSDPDGPSLGIAIVGGSSAGTLWFSINNGTTWSQFGPPSTYSDAFALLLLTGSGATTGRIYYEPATNVNGSINPVVTFRAWDNSAFGNGNILNIPSTGGSSSFSTATDTAGILVTAVNDAPVADNDTVVVNENTSTTTGSSVLDGDTDPDGNSLTAFKVSDPAHGTLTLNTNGTLTYSTSGYVGTDSFTYQAYDGTAFSNIATVSITVNEVGGGGGGGGGGCLIVC